MSAATCIDIDDNDVVSLDEQPSITFANMSGDVTISWTEENRERIIQLVKKKMEEGYVFFTMQKLPLVEVYRRAKVTPRNVNKIDNIRISDEDFDKMALSMDDRDVASALKSSDASLVKRKGAVPKQHAIHEMLKTPEDVVDKKAQSLAFRRVIGG